MVKLSYIYSIIFTLLVYGFSYSDTHYVSLDGTNDSAGTYTNWVGAATQIQWAVDAAINDDTVLVSNGTYYLTNQILVTNSIILKSFSGFYTNTIINGNYSGYTNKGVYITNSGAVLDGFTITNCYQTNYLIPGVAFYANPCKLITNCLFTGNMAEDVYGVGGFLFGGTVSHCSFIGNRVTGSSTYWKRQGPGLYVREGLISNCVISGNSGGSYTLACSDSAAASVFAVNCVISSNICDSYAVNAPCGVSLLSCIVSDNTGYGINLDSGKLRNCLVIKNRYYGINIGRWSGYNIEIENCTIANNGSCGIYYIWDAVSKPKYIANSIIYNNAGGNWVYVGTNIVYTNSCTIPIPTNMPGNPQGTGNITNTPLFADTNIANYRLSANSPCINTGTNKSWMTGDFDLDRKQRIRYGTVDMGAYERIYEGTIYKFH